LDAAPDTCSREGQDEGKNLEGVGSLERDKPTSGAL
jgi:hypothetical protein